MIAPVTGVCDEARLNGAAYCLGRGAGTDCRPDKTALLVLGDRTGAVRERWSFEALQSTVLRIAGGLRQHGLQPGERVLLRLGNSSDFPLVFFAVIAAGGVAVPTSAQLTETECDALVDSALPRFIVHDGATGLPGRTGASILLGPEDIEALKAGPDLGYADTRAGDPAYLVYTSGTGGAPKGVLHAHRAIPGRRPIYQGWYGIGPTDSLLHAGAFNWTYTLGAGLMDPWANGATSILYDGDRDPAIWPDLLASSGATLFAAVPGLYRRILKHSTLSRQHVRCLRHGLTAGEALREGLYRDWLERTGLPLYEALGMSEISTYISSSPSVPARPGSPGKPQPGRRVAILPDKHGTDPMPAGHSGQLCVHGSDPGLMLGYWRDAAATAAAYRGAWFVTGDRARMDPDGYVWHEGRADDLMNAFGYRVAPDEIERVLTAHPAIAEAAVIDIETADNIRLITAFLVLAETAQADSAVLERWCAERLAAYKRPKRFVIVPALPRSAAGKILRRSLPELAKSPGH